MQGAICKTMTFKRKSQHH